MGTHKRENLNVLSLASHVPLMLTGVSRLRTRMAAVSKSKLILGPQADSHSMGT